ncbi:putative periplasmic lipoprotein [Diaphorobacter caeni]|uniref:hypothetical protein n=1 Tax=Diaphorobacter caeni TaxID=2784387 RepID=UPI00188F1339|nr:hypothetical protein [Diaphorobacter caeni]MBF5007008.1 hypothetical protein [Diaphorobacter caeni]
MTNRFFTALVFIGAGLLSVVCTTVQSTPPVVAGCMTWEQQQSSGAAQRLGGSIQLLSPELARIVGVQDMGTARTPTGLASVQAEIYNCTDVDVVVLMRTRFSGDRGQSEPPSAWKTVFLPPRGQAVYGESAVSQSTRRVAVDIHDANREQTQWQQGQSYRAPMQSPAGIR